MPATISHHLLESTEDLGLLVREQPCPDAFSGGAALRFEFTSRGDRVPGRVLLPKRDGGPFPLLLLQPDAGESMHSESLEVAAPWLRAGAAIASIDLSLHGERSSPKFSERLLETLRKVAAGSESVMDDENGIALLIEFVRQTQCDFARSLDALASLTEVDVSRVGFAGIGTGASLGALFCSIDPRPRAVALILSAYAGAGVPDEIDPAAHIARIAPRPVLIVGDEGGGSSSGDALIEAAGEGSRQIVASSEDSHLSETSGEAIWTFLAAALGVR